MKTSIYDTIPAMSDEALSDMLRFWQIMTASRPVPIRHDYYGKCLLRACLEQERRINAAKMLKAQKGVP